ncbi:MAG: hypothetical protein HUU08_02535 [Candidatus Brocadia sp.]|nr:hypothetical protein [Candidatus Brocadia sp.]
MDSQYIKNTIAELRERAKIYSHELELNILEEANKIVEVGALTVGTDSKGKIIAQNVLYPTQFAQKAVEKILTMNWRNGNGKRIEPLVYGRNDWYREKLKMTNDVLKLIDKNKTENYDSVETKE